MDDLQRKHEIKELENIISLLDYDKKQAEAKLKLMKLPSRGHVSYGGSLPSEHESQIRDLLNNYFLNVRIVDRYSGTGIHKDMVVYRIAHNGYRDVNTDSHPDTIYLTRLANMGYYISGIGAGGLYLSLI